MNDIEIGLLDFGTTSGENFTPTQEADFLSTYVCHAEQLGYSRIWLAEHHNPHRNSLWLNPEIMIPILAGKTSRIRIGSGGIILSAHQPYRIAYTFKLLAGLFPNRIDLGIAGGHISGTTRSLFYPEPVSDHTYTDKLLSLLDIFRKEEELIDNDVIIPPLQGVPPPIWLLGSSYKKLDLVLQQGLNFSRSLFHFGVDLTPAREELERFREAYYHQHGGLPGISLAFTGCCHHNRQTAHALSERNSRGFVTNNVVGEPSEFADQVYTLAELFGIRQFIFLNTAAPVKEKLLGIELIADALGLGVSQKQNITV